MKYLICRKEQVHDENYDHYITKIFLDTSEIHEMDRKEKDLIAKYNTNLIFFEIIEQVVYKDLLDEARQRFKAEGLEIERLKAIKKKKAEDNKIKLEEKRLVREQKQKEQQIENAKRLLVDNGIKVMPE